MAATLQKWTVLDTKMLSFGVGTPKNILERLGFCHTFLHQKSQDRLRIAQIVLGFDRRTVWLLQRYRIEQIPYQICVDLASVNVSNARTNSSESCTNHHGTAYSLLILVRAFVGMNSDRLYDPNYPLPNWFVLAKWDLEVQCTKTVSAFRETGTGFAFQNGPNPGARQRLGWLFVEYELWSLLR